MGSLFTFINIGAILSVFWVVNISITLTTVASVRPKRVNTAGYPCDAIRRTSTLVRSSVTFRYVFTKKTISSKSLVTSAIIAPNGVGACRICVTGFAGWKRLCRTLIHIFTLLAVPAVPFLTGTLPEGRQVGTVGSCFVAVMGVFFTFIDIYAGEAVPSEPFVTFTDIAPVHVTTD